MGAAGVAVDLTLDGEYLYGDFGDVWRRFEAEAEAGDAGLLFGEDRVGFLDGIRCGVDGGSGDRGVDDGCGGPLEVDSLVGGMFGD